MASLQAEEVELPSPDLEAESPVELPEELLKLTPCCKHHCEDRVTKNPWLCSVETRLKNNLQMLDLPDRNVLWFNQLLSINRADPQGPKRRWLTWHGVQLCQKAYSEVTELPIKKLRQYLALIAEGHVKAPVDGRACPLARPQPKREDVDSFFAYVYDNLAEPLALSRDQIDAEICAIEAGEAVGGTSEPKFELVAVPEWLQGGSYQASLSVELAQAQVEKRWLPTMSNSELFDLYKDLHADHEHLSSWSSFSRAWKQWQSILGMRPPHQHSRCDTCAKYSKFRRLAATHAEHHLCLQCAHSGRLP